MRLLICGGRNYRDVHVVRAVIEALAPRLVITGDATGADACAAKMAELLGIETIICDADWETHGRAAGPIRNAEMLEKHRPDLVIAFPGGRGTADMMAKAGKAGVRVRKVGVGW
ncbi:MAG: SLOG family protein [Pseudomonadota bacterium]